MDYLPTPLALLGSALTAELPLTRAAGCCSWRGSARSGLGIDIAHPPPGKLEHRMGCERTAW